MNREQARQGFRILTAAVLVVAGCLPPVPSAVRSVLFLMTYGLVGYDVLWGALTGLFAGEFLDERFLMTLATAGALALGDNREAALVMLLYQIGEWFQELAEGKSRRSIEDLMAIRPDTAVVWRDGAAVSVSPDEVAVGETIRVLPGERIPLDGILLSGETSLNTAALTGESRPCAAGVGDRVASGVINLTGEITVQTTCAAEDSTASRILHMVETASARKAHAETFMTRFARYYTPAVVAGALLLAVVPPLLAGGWRMWLSRALIFLVVSCPCALVISVPLSFFGGIGGMARRGILVKGAEYVEALARLDTVAFDKTGTLTRGAFDVVDVQAVSGTEEELLTWTAAVEAHSRHPIAASVVRACPVGGTAFDVTEVKEHPGCGIEATVNGHTVLVGHGRWLAPYIDLPPERADGTLLHVVRDGGYLGYLVTADTVKPGTAESIAALRRLGIGRMVMLTGDRTSASEAVAAEIGMDEVHSECLPGDKVRELETLLAPGRTVAFVGDGINDAPVLSRADVGIAMGALGSDAAAEAADVVLMRDSVGGLAEAVRIARKTRRIVRENIGLALGVKALVLLTSAAGLTGMGMAVFADVGVSVLAVLNAMRTLAERKERYK